MKLYRSRVPTIAHAVLERLANEGDIEIEATDRAEAEQDLVAIMENYLNRDKSLRDKVGEDMERRAIPYDQFGKVKSEIAEAWGHPVGDDVDRFLARQFIENFMISRFVDEVFAEDKDLYKRVREIVEQHDVDERALRQEAQDQIRNISEGSVDYEIALSKAMRDVKKRHGLLQ